MRYAESINGALHELFESDSSVFLIGEDLLDPYGGAFKISKGLSTKFPDRVLTMPISEAGFTGFATGMAMRGLRPIVEIMFGDFITLCADQIVNHAAKFKWMYADQVDVPLVIRAPMGGRRGYGPTHSQNLESLFYGTPFVNIVAPSVFHDPGRILKNLFYQVREPLLFIENKVSYSQFLKAPDSESKIDGVNFRLVESANKAAPTAVFCPNPRADVDVTLVCHANIATVGLEAVAQLYREEELNVELLVPAQLKPFPIEHVIQSVKRSRRAIFVDEGVATAGWIADVAAKLSEAAFPKLISPVLRVGSKDCPVPNSIVLENQVLPGKNEIFKAVEESLKF